ncbi:MAG: HAMP domain-containing protein [Firmicutes bacterium]|nr:HAMP domain-containing protein [Bacillota bacterium]
MSNFKLRFKWNQKSGQDLASKANQPRLKIRLKADWDNPVWSQLVESRILRKITLVILTIALGGIILSDVIINVALNRQFQNYLSEIESARQKQIVEALTEFYQENQGWGNFRIRIINIRQNPFLGNLLYVTDQNNQVVIARRLNMMDFKPDSLVTYPLIVNGVRVGTAYFSGGPLQSILSHQDELFRRTINGSIFWSLLITGLISLIVAVVFAKRLSTPITAMNQTAKSMTAGNLDVRVSNLPEDELGELGNSLNQLAARLKEVDTLRKDMTANVAHDLRTPLATVKSHLEGMIDTVIPPSTENLESLLEEINRLIILVEDLQAIASADANISRFIKKRPVELGPFLMNIVKKMAPLFQGKGVELIPEGVPELAINTDQKALTKIMVNLLSNAYKFTPSGKRVFLSACLQKTEVLLTVRDEGIGIDSKDLPFIFERFYRTDHSRNRESGGFGLGLTIVKELVAILGGTVEATSVPGEGSTFTVRLPV